LKDSKPTII